MCCIVVPCVWFTMMRPLYFGQLFLRIGGFIWRWKQVAAEEQCMSFDYVGWNACECCWYVPKNVRTYLSCIKRVWDTKEPTPQCVTFCITNEVTTAIQDFRLSRVKVARMTTIGQIAALTIHLLLACVNVWHPLLRRHINHCFCCCWRAHTYIYVYKYLYEPPKVIRGTNPEETRNVCY